MKPRQITELSANMPSIGPMPGCLSAYRYPSSVALSIRRWPPPAPPGSLVNVTRERQRENAI
jgi:hypothetical protein